MTTTTHIAAQGITIGPRSIQRCALCGYKFMDEDSRRIAVPSDQGPYSPSFFATGAYVQVAGNRMSMQGMAPTTKGEDPPRDLCIDLVEEPGVV